MNTVTLQRLKKILIYVGLVFFSLLFTMPFLWMLSSSFKTTGQIFSMPPKWIPHPVVSKNYADAVSSIPFLRYLFNTLVICAGTIVGNVLSASLVAYSLGVLKWKGRDLSFKVLIATMLLPPQATMIPVFIIFRQLGMVDTWWPLILPAFLGTPFFVFLLRQFFLGIPNELMEAAVIDGCNEWGIYWRVVLPLSVPALATVTLFSFIWSWTDFLTPLIYLQDQAKFTLSLGLQQFQESHTVEWGMLMAASTLITLPIIILFFFTQKTFVEGIQTSGLKG